MLRLLKFLWTGDWHMCKWETIDTYQVFSSEFERLVGERPKKIEYHCKCSICGRHKKFD